jgi:predicted HAD superfamily Cof-like phosphohydrolase
MNCSICGVGATMSVGAEPRCPDHVDVRVSRLSRQVAAFHKAFDLPTATKPIIPSDDRIRLRLKLIAEEFFELLTACKVRPVGPAGTGPTAQEMVMQAIAEDYVRGPDGKWIIDFPQVVDTLADLDYVVEGTRLEFGINGSPIADEVHRSNMSKVGGEIRSDGKKMKGPNWSPPDIAGELRRQGWSG